MATKRIRKSKRNRGGYLLARLGIPNAELARQLGVTASNITHWTAGRTKPEGSKRDLLFQLHTIPLASWDEPVRPVKPSDSKAETASDGAVAVAIPASVQGKAASLEAFLAEQMAWIQDPANEAAPLEKLNVVSKCSAVLAQLGKITGEDSVTSAKILASAYFRTIVERISEAARPWPEAAGAIGEALRKLEAETS